MFDRVSRVLRGLRSTNAKRQKKAYDRIWHINITPRTGIRLIEAAGETFPNDGLVEGYKRINCDLIQFLWRDPYDAFVDSIERVYDHLVDKEEAREQVLRLLTEIHTEESLSSFVRLLKRPSSETVDLDIVFIPLIGSADWAPDKPPLPEGTAMFPDLFDLLDRQRHTDEIYRVISSYAKSGLITLNDYPEFLARCVGRSRKAITGIAAALQRQQASESDEPGLSDEERKQVKASASELRLLLELLPMFGSSTADDVLRETLKLDLPNFQTWAAAGLLARDQSVDPQILDSVVRRPDLRAALWDALRKADKLAAFPSDYRNEQALAEAEMVKWLEFPTEMGQPPEEIELLKVHEHDDPNEGRVHCYFFKFRHSDFLEGKWLVGMAGPYRAGAPPTMYAGGTFSHFQELETQDLDSHVRGYLDDDQDESPTGFTLPVDDG
jgi:hypothetical protein